MLVSHSYSCSKIPTSSATRPSRDLFLVDIDVVDVDHEILFRLLMRRECGVVPRVRRVAVGVELDELLVPPRSEMYFDVLGQ